MCELFGMSSQKPCRAVESLSAFRRLSGENPDGWGLAYYMDGCAAIEKEASNAGTSQKFERLMQTAESRIFIAHLRAATQGEVCTENCHPFRRESFQRDWIFAHNGTIENIHLHELSCGTTDSEQAFLRMIDDIESYVRQSDFHGLYPGIKQSIRNLFSRYSRRITINFLLSDGCVLYAFNHYPEKPLFISRRISEGGSTLLISTSRLDKGGDWRQIPQDRVMLVTEGSVLVLSSPL